MSVGKNIKKLRIQNSMTQKSLGIALGFSESCADVRIAQYESGDRNPKSALIVRIASVFKVNPEALTASDVDKKLLFSLNELENMCKYALCEISSLKEIMDERIRSSDEIWI